MDERQAPALATHRARHSSVIPAKAGIQAHARTNEPLSPPNWAMTVDALYYRGRESRLPGPPSLRTVRAVLPHTALQLMVLPRRGLNDLCTGCHQAEQPVFGKVFVGPFLMVAAPSAPFSVVPPAQY